MDSAHETYRHRHIHRPERQWEGDPTDVIVRKTSDRTPVFSIVMPIFNQEAIIQAVLTSVVKTTAGVYEILLILDGCTDGTRDKVLEWIETTQFPDQMVLLRVLESKSEMFETSCDNLGFVLSRGRYLVEIQADMIIETPEYNVQLAIALETYPDMIAASGRCCHTINNLTRAGWVGKWGEINKHSTSPDGRVYLSHTVNRGPLVLRRSMVEQLGFLDELNYVLGDDDHDLFARAWTQHKWRTGHIPIDYESQVQWGSMRKPKTVEVQETIRRRTTGNGFFQRNRATILFPSGEIRAMSTFEIQRARTIVLSNEISQSTTLISGKAFSDKCKWVIDPRYPDRTPFSYAAANDGDWVFLNGDYLNRFVAEFPITPVLTKRFYVVIHNTDLPFTEEGLTKIRKYVYHVFAVNSAIQHPRVTPIPLGFADNQLEFLASYQPDTKERDIEIYLNITARHNWDRRKVCVDAFATDPRVVHRGRVSVPDYYADLCRSKFVLCPEGTGMDTHRLYEALLCGAIPVVVRNPLTPLYQTLPVCILNQWTDPLYVPTPKPSPLSVDAYLRR
jgi:hypothetical protein